MFGAIIGDIIGSRFEFNNIKSKDFDLFTPECSPTDDSIMTLAIAKAFVESKIIYTNTLDGERLKALRFTAIKWMRKLGLQYPNAGYGDHFWQWLNEQITAPYHSYGNGAAMRVSACAHAADSIEDATKFAHTVTHITHDHPEGLKGAEATTTAIYLALHGSSKEEIRQFIQTNYYPLNFTLDEIRTSYLYDVSCQGTVPQAIVAFLESTSFEDAIRNAISIGGDSDTLGAITGSIAEAFYGIPSRIKAQALTFLDLNLLTILNTFMAIYEGKDVMGTPMLSGIFRKRPNRWGYRGDRHFWNFLTYQFADVELPYSPDNFERDIKEYFLQLTGNNMSPRAECYVKQFDLYNGYGGMSAGCISVDWWLETAIPLLRERIMEYTSCPILTKSG